MPVQSPEVYKNPETFDKNNSGLVETISREPIKLHPEVESWLLKLEKSPGSATTQNADPVTAGQIKQLQVGISNQTKKQLPATRSTFVAGFAKKIEEVGRWLSVFVLRLIKKYDGEAEFKL